MKICLASLHPRRLSGQVDSLVALARELDRLGHEVRMITAFNDSSLAALTALPAPEAELGASATGKLLAVANAVRDIAALGGDADLLHLNLPTPAFSWIGDLIATRNRHTPMMIGYEAHLADLGQLIQRGWLWSDPAFYLPRLLVNNGLWGRLSLFRASRYIVASQWQRAELRSLGVPDSRMVSLPNLIDRGRLRLLPRDAARQALGLDQSAFLIGWAGHFHHVKGLDLLLQAFAQMSRKAGRARLVLAWSGIGNRRPIERAIDALDLGVQVDRLQRVPMGTFMSGVDALVLPYRQTIGQGAYPNLVMEAMAVGVPLVTSDLPLLRELVGDSDQVQLVPPEDVLALTAALESLESEPEPTREQLERRRAQFLERFDPVALARRYVGLYDEIIAGHS